MREVVWVRNRELGVKRGRKGTCILHKGTAIGMVERTTDRVECHILVTPVFDQKVNLVTFTIDDVYEDASGYDCIVFIGDIRPKGFCSGNDASMTISGSIESTGAERVVRQLQESRWRRTRRRGEKE